MKRLATIFLILCAGCASPGGDNLLEDSCFGDLRALFSSRPDYSSPVPSAQNSYNSYSSGSPAPAPKQN